MAHWGNHKGDPKGRNDYSCADPSSESEAATFKHGNFSNKATEVSAEDQLGGEGSRGLAINQGFIDTAIKIPENKGHLGQKIGRIKTERQGTHAQLGSLSEKKSRERV